MNSINEAVEVVEEHTEAEVITGETITGPYLVIQKRITQGERVALQNRLDPELIEVSEIDPKTMVRL